MWSKSLLAWAAMSILTLIERFG